MLDPVDGLEARRAPARRRQQPDREVGAGPLVVQRVEAALRQPLRRADERVDARPPGGDRVLLVEPQHVQQLLLEPLEPGAVLELREDEVGPRLRRARADRPVGRTLVDDLDALLDRRQPVLADEPGIEVDEQAGRARPGERHARGALLAERQHALAVPRRDEVERLRSRVLDPRALDVGIEPGDVDELRAVPVGARRERAHEVLLAGLAADRDDLVRLHVGAEADGEVGERARVASSIRGRLRERPATFLHCSRRGARVVESGGLENRCAGNRTEGSNPSPSAHRPM